MPSKFRAPLFRREYEEWEAKIKAAPKTDIADTVALPAWAKDGYRTVHNGGEKEGYRDAMDGMTRQLIEAGNSPDYAREKARESARRVDVRSDNDGKLK